MEGQRAQWGSRVGFILAAAGSAVGLGNIWKFPYITGENGGGLFVLIYLVCIALVGIPIMMAEIMIGRAAQAQPVVAFERLQSRRTPWAAVGWLGVIAGFVILSYYIVVAGWAMDYTLKSVVNVAKPIHEQAQVEGSQYRAEAPLEEMRLILTARQAEHETKDAIARARATVKPSVWRAHDRYAAALAQAGAKDIALAELMEEVWGDVARETVEAIGGVEILTSREEPAVEEPEQRPEVEALLEEVVATVNRMAEPDAGAASRYERIRASLLATARTTVGRICVDCPEMTEEAKARYREVRAVLMEDADLAGEVEQAEDVMSAIEAIRRDGLLAAWRSYESRAAAEVRDEAENLFRRAATFEQMEAGFNAVAGDGWTCSFWSTIFMMVTILIVAGGISAGIERACRFLMPTLIVLILVMVVYGVFQRGFGEAASFVFKPDPTKLKPSGVLEALGHAFFTLSLGMGAMITYGSYQRHKTQIVGQSVAIAVLDTTIALLACMMIFPIIFSYDQEPAAGPGLVFKSMPLAFAEIGKGGMLLAILFFGLLVFAALTSAISLLEVVASYFIDQLGWNRRKAAWVLGGIILVFGFASAFSADPEFMMEGWEPSFGKNFFDTMDYLASNWMLPAGGLFIALYVGWVMPKKARDAELTDVAPLFVWGWLLLVRLIAPALVVVVLLQKVGVLDADEIFHGLFN